MNQPGHAILHRRARISSLRLRLAAASLIALALGSGPAALAESQEGGREEARRAARPSKSRTVATPTFVDVGGPASVAPSELGRDTALERAVEAGLYDPNRLLAGHLLRRIGFGPTPAELKKVTRKGLAIWIEKQLKPEKIGDAKAESLLPPRPNHPDEDYDWIRRWLVRMVYTKRQLQEKMTLIWHEHFATSNEKVGSGLLMNDHEELLRASSLGSFRELLIGITKDQAMLIWLDNNYNDGRAEEPPNENYAREFLQLFTTGTRMLNLDGTPVTATDGSPVPAYTETDVREVARALTGWYADWPYKRQNTQFSEWMHDEGPKTIMGATLPGRTGEDGANEVADIVDLVLAQRQTTVAAFISKMLIQKLATETPSTGYVSDVATVFIATNGNLKETVRRILTHPEFTAPSSIRTMYKEPLEQFVGAIRAIGGETRGNDLVDWSYDAGQLIYYPPSVFSFYPPGDRGALVNTATVFVRDRVADEFVRGWDDTKFNPAKLIKVGKLKTPEGTVDYLSDVLLAAPLQDEVRAEMIAYMGGQVTEDKVKGVVWLLMCSPDFQRN